MTGLGALILLGDPPLTDSEVLALAGAEISLDRSPKKNWVEESGGLPNYIKRIAKHLLEKGMDMSHAIAVAISMCKKWAAGGKDVHPDTRAKAAAAIAEWEKLKATSHAKSAAKDAGKLAASASGGRTVVFAQRLLVGLDTLV